MLDRLGRPCFSTSQLNEPREKKQLYNCLYQLNRTPSSPINKENKQMIEEEKKNGMIESVVVNNKAHFFFMCSSNQI